MLPIQIGTGDPSPENVRPIYGYTAATAHRTGKNLFDAEDIVESSNRPTYCYIDSGYLRFTTGNPVVRGLDWTGIAIPCPLILSGKVKDFSGSSGSVRLNAYFSDGTSQTNIINVVLQGNDESDFVSVVIGDSEKTLIRLASSWTASNDVGFELDETQLEVGSTSTSFTPYQGDTYNIQFGQTIYGGTLDFVTGVLTATYGFANLGDLTWSLSGAGFFTVISDAIHPIVGGDENAVCSCYSKGIYADGNLPDKTFDLCNSRVSSKKYLLIKDSTYEDAESFKAAVTGQTISYTLADPQTFQLTPQEITTLYGTNNIWTTTTTNQP